MTDKAELPDEIWSSTLIVTDDDPNMVMGFWGPRRFKDGVRYIRADLIKEREDATIASQAAEIKWLKGQTSVYDALKVQINSRDTLIASQAAEIAALKAAMRASFDEHGSAPTDCDYSKCTRLAVLLDYLPVVNDGHP